MSWKDSLLDASFRGVRLHVLNVDDGAERALVRHEYPYRDGAEVEDLGRRARTIRLQAFFWGASYESSLKQLLDALDKSGAGELIHPVFGSLTVAVANHTVTHHEDNPDSCQVALDFVEASPDVPFFSGGVSASGKAGRNVSALQGAFDAAVSSKLAAVQGLVGKTASTLSQLARGDMLSAMRTVMDQAASLGGVNLPVLPDYLGQGGGQLQGLFGSARSIISSVSVISAMPDAFGRLASLSSLSDLLPRLSLAQGGSSTSYAMTPALFAGQPVTGPLTGQAVAQPLLVLDAAGSQSGASTPDMTTAAGQGRAIAAATWNLEATRTVTEAAAQTLAAEVQAPTMTPAEVEAVVGVCRQRIQDSMADVRAVYPTHAAYPITEQLRTAALAIQDMGADAIHLHPPVVVYAPPALCNLHLAAHWLYADYTRSEELARLNPGLRNPNFIAARQALNVYSS